MSVVTIPEADGAHQRDRRVSTKPTVVCLTPMRDEAWMIERFLACTALWADHIVIADQGSTDGSREIAAAHPKVTVIDNPDRRYDEGARQRLLLETARELVDGPRFLLALDVDEVLSANWMTSPEWRTALSAPPGTVVCFQRAELLEYERGAWQPLWDWPCGFVDDGSMHQGTLLHSDRVPAATDAPALLMRDVKVLHYAGVDMRRARSRNRWYQCWEALNRPERRATAIFRKYHPYDRIPPHEHVAIDASWTAGYERQGIDMTSVRRDGPYRWDSEVLDLLVEHGPERFRRVELWNTD